MKKTKKRFFQALALASVFVLGALYESVHLRVSHISSPSSSISVKEYGAVGNGTVDDTVAIQKAINVAPTHSTVYFPSGTYKISKTITLLGDKTYAGAGTNTIIKLANGSNVTMFNETPPVGSTTVEHFTMKGLEIDGNKASNSGGYGLYLNGVEYSTIENLRVINVGGSGIVIDGATSTLHINNCWSMWNNGFGLYMAGGGADIHVLGGEYGANQNENLYVNTPSTTIENVVAWGSKLGSGIQTVPYTDNVEIRNSEIEGNFKNGIDVQSKHAMIIGNKIYDNSDAGNYLYSNLYTNSENTMIMDNAIYAGLYSNQPTQCFLAKAAIELGAFHLNTSIFGNAIDYNGYGTRDTSRTLVTGLQAGDRSDHSWMMTQ